MFSLPYLFIDSDHVDAVFAGEPGQLFRDNIWNSNHVMILDYWDSGFRHYSTNKGEINGPEDMAGQLIRIPDNPFRLPQLPLWVRLLLRWAIKKSIWLVPTIL